MVLHKSINDIWNYFIMQIFRDFVPLIKSIMNGAEETCRKFLEIKAIKLTVLETHCISNYITF